MRAFLAVYETLHFSHQIRISLSPSLVDARDFEKSRKTREMNPEKLKKLQAQAELVRIGGKGKKSARNNLKLSEKNQNF